MITGHRKEFQEPMNTLIATMTSAGRTIGTPIEHRKRSREAPSSAAASRISAGMVRKNWRTRKIPNTLAPHGMIWIQ